MTQDSAGDDRGRSRRRLAVAATVVAVALILGGIWWNSRSGDDAPAATTPTSPTTPASPSPTDEPSKTQDMTLYFAGKTGGRLRLFPEERTLSWSTEAANAVVTADSEDPDTLDLWPAGIEVTAVHFDGIGDDGFYGVEFADDHVAQRPAGMSEEDARVLVEGLVRSVQAGTEHAGVDFYVTGAPDAERLKTVLGVDTSTSLHPGDDQDFLAPVYLTAPANHAEVDATFTVTGRAAAFEATVEWELSRDGSVVKDGFTTAEECCTHSPYSFEITAEPGQYLLTVRNTDPSDGEGGPVDQDRREITVR